jgi:predicted ATPase
VAAFFGSRFDVRDVADYSQCTIDQAENDLWRALHGGTHCTTTTTTTPTTPTTLWLSPLGRFDSSLFVRRAGFILRSEGFDYNFLHDRVQQAAYECVDKAQRKQAHFTIGLYLMNKLKASEEASVPLLSSFDRCA